MQVEAPSPGRRVARLDLGPGRGADDPLAGARPLDQASSAKCPAAAPQSLARIASQNDSTTSRGVIEARLSPYDPRRARRARKLLTGCRPSSPTTGCWSMPSPSVGVSASVIWWDEPALDWSAHDAVVIRSTWNYARRRDAFLAWCDRVGPRFTTPAARALELRQALPPRPRRGRHPGGRDGLRRAGRPGPGAGWRDRGQARDLGRRARLGTLRTGHPRPRPRPGGGDPLRRANGDAAAVPADGRLAGRDRRALHRRRAGACAAQARGAAAGRDRPGARRRGRGRGSDVRPALVTAGEADDDELALARDVVAEVRPPLRLPAAIRTRRHDPRRRREADGARARGRRAAFYLEQVPATAALAARAIIARAGG